MISFLKSKNILVVFVAIIISGCTNEFDFGKLENAVKTIEYNNITQTSVEVIGNVLTDNGASLSSKGVCYGIDDNPTTSGLYKINTNLGLGMFTCTLENLDPSTIYYARAFATNSYGTAYGQSVKFKTLDATVPIISSTIAANLITPTSAKTGGIITNSGAAIVTSRGVCYSATATVPTIANTKTIDGTGIGTFSSSLSGLTPNTIYYIRAYATNSIGTAYGDVKSFSTSQATSPTSITTLSSSLITQNSANSGGNINDDGGSSITSRGVCWSNSTSNPTIFNNKTVNGAGVGSFSSSMSGLLPGTTYYVRAYGTNSVGTAYGNVISFTTISASIPTGLLTNAVSSITQSNAIGGGSINSDGGALISNRGICWSYTNSTPTIGNSKTIDGSGTGSFTSVMTGLTAGKTYYVRAYATNTIGTAYGSIKTFTTNSSTIPTNVITTVASSITQNAAISGGSVGGDGGAAIFSRGICFSTTSTNPTTNSSVITSGSGTGNYTSSLTGLIANKTYYVRAFATNGMGTAYGNTISFTTSQNLTVGQNYQGGIIGYIFEPGDVGYVPNETHGIITTISNQSTGVSWGCSGTTISGINIAIGSGLTNTTAIVNGCSTSNIAAKICYNLTTGGYSDWFLPSIYELYELYYNRTLIGGFSNAGYWSSSQQGSTTAYTIDFSTGNNYSTPKTNLSMYVRAIKYF